jgi:hypothetical protein
MDGVIIAKSHTTECRCAKCRGAECHGASKTAYTPIRLMIQTIHSKKEREKATTFQETKLIKKLFLNECQLSNTDTQHYNNPAYLDTAQNAHVNNIQELCRL